MPISQIARLDETEGLIKSSFRTMAIFEFFADIQRPALITEISRALNIPQSSTSTIVGSLVDTGYLTKDPHSRTITPSMRLNFLTAWRGDSHPDAANLNCHLKALREDSGETAVLAMKNGIYSHYILVQHSHDILRKHIETGSVRPLVCSATGWSLLANEENRDIEKLISQTKLTVKNSRWIETSGNAIRNIERVRNLGYAWSDGEAAIGASGLAMSIPSGTVPARFSIAIAGPSARMTEKKEDLLELLKTFVDRLPNDFTNAVLA